MARTTTMMTMMVHSMWGPPVRLRSPPGLPRAAVATNPRASAETARTYLSSITLMPNTTTRKHRPKHA